MLDRRGSLFLLPLLGLVPVSARAQGFEGVVHSREIAIDGQWLARQLDSVNPNPVALLSRTPDELLALARQHNALHSVLEVEYDIKGQRLRINGVSGIDSTEAGNYTVLDFQRGVFRMVRPADRTYVETTADQLRELARATQDSLGARQSSAVLQPLGQTRRLLGVQCEGYRIQASDRATVAWVSDAFGDLAQTFRQFGAYTRSLAGADGQDPTELLAEKGYPVVVTTLTTDGEISVQEVTMVRAEAVPDARFAAPAGFTRQAVGGNRP
jgi:hypothetical protein